MHDTEREFYVYMEEYTIFLERMLADENEKLASLNSRDLRRIERSITVAQANAKQLENYEVKRIELQKQAGLAGLAFKELVEKAPEQKKTWLQQIFSRFDRSVTEIRFRNDKSMNVARDNMLDIDPSAILPGSKPVNPYSKMKKEEKDGQSGILETKI